MSILNWNPPAKPTVYNNPDLTWQATLYNAGQPHAHIQINKVFKSTSPTKDPTKMVLIVGLDGWEGYKAAGRTDVLKATPGAWAQMSTKGLNVRVSMNGPLYLTFEEFAELQQAVDEAKTHLEGLLAVDNANG